MVDILKTTILNIDDDHGTRYAISRVLRQAGFEVKEAASGREALKMAKEHPDLILLDIQLPDINGFEVCRRIKSDPATSHIPILHLSAVRLEDHDKVEGLETGADSYLTQPISPRVLISSVKALLRIRQAEKKASEYEARYRDIFNSSTDAFLIFDLDGSIVDCNPSACRMFGYAHSELTKLSSEKIIHPDYQHNFELLKQNSQEEDLFPLELISVHKDGTFFTAEVQGTLFDFMGIQHLLFIVRDITKQKRDEEELKKYRLYLEELIKERTAELTAANEQLEQEIRERNKSQTALAKIEENLSKAQQIAHLGSWEWNIETSEEVWSDEMFRIFGYQPGQMKPTYDHFLEALHPEDRDKVLQAVKQVIDGGNLYKIEFRIIRPDKSVRTILAQGQVYRDEDGKPGIK